jgi:peptidoglycan/LPS O-acetylase OafA/YrhL
VLASKATLALYFFGAAYLAVLAWAAVVHDVINDPSGEGRARAGRLATGYLIAGLVHPVLALAAWDIARQVDAADPDGAAIAARVRRLAPVVVAVSVAAAVVLFLLADR